ncbi:MAG: N4-gp56 family major capsid protein, partial [Thermoplasmata archaeon]|nr:N4-gp56 family major capsid protein [Thermoplasmata archaeon]
YERYSAATTPLTEGITPTGHKQSKVDLTATVSQYGDYAIITDVVDLTVEDKNIVIEVERQADQMRNTEDTLTRDVLANAASSLTCSNGSGTSTLLNATDIATVTQTLRNNNAQYTSPMIKAGQGQGTFPIRASFWGIANTANEHNLENVSGFKSVTNYANGGEVDPTEFGATTNVRWLTTTQGYYSSTSYYNLIVAKEAYGVIDLNSGSAKSIVKTAAGMDDPLEQRAATVGWKMWQVARIINDANMMVLISTI